MEAVRKSQPHLVTPPTDAPAAAKLTIEKFADGGISCLKFSGMIDESFEGKKIGRSVQCDTLVLDLGGVKKISSFGIREWVDFIGVAVKQCKQLILIECAPKVVDQLNMVANFAGGGRVFSFYAPFRCDYCDSEHRVLLEVNKDYEAIKSMKLAERPCPSCKESMYFDEDGSTYFSYLLTQGPFELDHDVIGFLAAKLDYRIGTIDSKLHIDKIIDGRITYLRLSGDLNNTFPREKIAEGLEGTVIVDLGAVSRVEPAGAAEWRSFVQQVTPLIEQLYVIGASPAFLEKLGGKDDLGTKVVVVDFTLPYACTSCSTTSQQTIDVSEHHAVLKFATAPELRCPTCKHAMQATASETLMTILPGLPKPTITKELALKLAELRARKLEKKPNAVTRGATETAASKASPLVPILLGLLVLVVIGGGVMFYLKGNVKQEPGPFGMGAVVQRSGAQRPAWIQEGTAPGAAYCAEAGGGLTCVGVSTVSASQEDAEDEASDAASESIAFELGKRAAAADKAWGASVPPMYLSARDAKLAAMNRDTQSTQARREVREGRHAVALALRGAAPPASARYWEAFDTREGRRYVAFVQATLSPADAQRMTDGYLARASALGATVVALFPEVAWRYPRLEHGAIVVGLQHGPVQDLGVAERYVITMIDGKQIVDAADFAKIAADEHATLLASGGAFRLVVQADSSDPREFSKQFPAPAVYVAPPSHGGHGGHGTHDTGGAVNIWDRTSHGSSGRDDPTQ